MLTLKRKRSCFSIGACVLIGCLFFASAIFSQSYTRADSIRIYSLLDQADDEAITGTLKTTRQYAEQALQLSRDKKMLRGEGYAKLKIAMVIVRESGDEDVNTLFADGLRIGTQLKDSFMMALACYQKGQYLMFDDQNDEAEKLFQTALNLQFNKIESGHKGQVYNDMGYLYGQKGELEKKAQWLIKAMQVHEQLHNLSESATTMGNLGVVYLELGNKAEAIRYIKKAIVIREGMGDALGLTLSYGNLANIYLGFSIDSAIYYQEKAGKYAEKNGLKSAMIQSYTNLSGIFDMKAKNGDREKNKTEALRYIRKAIDLSKEMNEESSLPIKMRWAGQLSGDLNDTISMEAYFQAALQIANKTKNKLILKDVYGAIAATYEKKKNYQGALMNLKNYYVYRDSIVNDQTATNIAELQTKYETEKKDNEINRLSTEQQIKQLEIEKQKAVIAGNKLEAAQKESEIKLLSQQQLLRDSRIQQQSEELEKQLLLAKNNQQELQLAETEKKLKDKQLQSQKQVRNGMIVGIMLLALFGFVLFNRYQLKKKIQQQNALLAVRNNIAKDLHDEIGSTLTSIKILSQVSHNNLHKDQVKASSMLEKITEQSSQMQQGMSDIVWAIAPDNDKLENMVVRMREYLSHTLESRNIETDFAADERTMVKSISMEQRRDFFLIFKEAINNIAKYSNAKQVSVRLSSGGGKIILAISDDGIGFDPQKVTSSNGLKNMRTRAEALHGRIRIHSALGKGSTIELEIPTT